MHINYCKLTQDLLPLYADNLISDDTKKLIDWHLDQCSNCRNNYMGIANRIEPEKLNGLEDNDRYESANRFLHTVHRRIRGAAVFMLAMLILIGSVSFFYGQKLSTEKPLAVNSAEDYAAKVVPGWDRAERSGQILPLGITKPIEGTQAEVTFEKVWFNQAYTIVLYSVKDRENNFYLALEEEIDYSPDQNMANNPGMLRFGPRFGGISKDGMHQVMVFMGYNALDEEITLNLNVPRWIQGPFPSKENKQISSPISIALNLKKEYLQEKVETIALSSTLEWGPRKLLLEKLEVGSSKNILYGRVILPAGETFQNIQGFLDVNGQQVWLNTEKVEADPSNPNTFSFTAYTEPFNQWPKPIHLQIQEIRFQTSANLTFPFDWSKYKESQSRMRVDEIDQTPQTFYDSTIRIWQMDQQGLSFKVESIKGQNNPIKIEPSSGRFVVTDESGQLVSPHIGSTWSGNIFGNNDDGFGFGIKREDRFWQSNNKVVIQLVNPSAKLVVEEKIEINP